MKRIFRRIAAPYFLLLLTAFCAVAQTDAALTELPLTDLSAFKSPGGNWQMAGGVTGSFTDSQLKSQPGQGVLVNTLNENAPKYQSSQNLFTAMEHGDMIVELDFMLPKGSNSGIYLQSRYEIQLFDSWGVKTPKVTDCGSIYERWDDSRPDGQKGYQGHPPRTNACFAPGLWQHLAIEFQAPRFDASGKKTQPARFVKVVLNGVTLHENVILSGPTRAAAFTDEVAKAPLMIQGDHGPVAFRNIRYAFQEDFDFAVRDLTYTYYETDELKTMEQITASQRVRSGPAETIDSRLADAQNNYCLVFTGKFDVKQADTYYFTMPLTGTGELTIDDKTVIASQWVLIRDKPLTGKTTLSAGTHSFKLTCFKNTDWAPPGLGLTVQKTNGKPKPLHAPASLPAPEFAPLIAVQPSAKTEIVRSFLMHNGKKKTHCLSVGDPAGVHYSYDLNQAGVLQIWKGEFLNTTDMWHERGEPQTAAAMGAGIPLPGVCPVVLSTDNARQFPDSLNKDELRYKGYALDAERHPTFTYQYQNVTFTDQLTPYENGNGLTRQLTLQNTPAGKQLAFRLAEGKAITEVDKGIFTVETDQASFYVRVLGDAKIKPEIVDNQGKKVLVVPYQSGKKTVNELKYAVIW